MSVINDSTIFLLILKFFCLDFYLFVHSINRLLTYAPRAHVNMTLFRLKTKHNV